MKTMLLPCRHVMYWRLMQGKSAIPLRYIEPRWKLSCKLNQPAAEENLSERDIACTTFQVRNSAMTARRHQVLNGTTKYKHVLERGKRIADIMSRNGTIMFGEMMEALEKFEVIIKDGVAPFVGREVRVDPLSQLSSLSFTFGDNSATSGPADVVMANAGSEESNQESTLESTDEQPATQPAATPNTTLDFSGNVPGGTWRHTSSTSRHTSSTSRHKRSTPRFG
jgi:hypothetical protein